ncbi:MAG TPA: magnesium transporter [Thermoanaerobaculia bacterium]|jgi:magnesium transporter|nr:magnesium transporter [Thermoanaerobaculia bacterium]
MTPTADPTQAATDPSSSQELAAEATLRGSHDVVRMLAGVPPATIVEVLQSMNPAAAGDVLEDLPPERRNAVLSAASPQQRAQWIRNERYPEDSIGRLMELPNAVFRPDQTIADTIEFVRELAKSTLVTYLFVVEGGKFVGVITMRDLLLADRSARLGDVMLRNPFFLTPQMEVGDAMKEVVRRHFPVYPVCEADGTLVGMVRGQTIFEEQTYEISAQAGRMVGVDKEERLTTPWLRSLKFRHPWLQLNLLTAFIAAAVVGLFQGTIDRMVILAAFLPVLAGQSGNTGCQALAVALRGMTLGELKPGREKALVMKEALLGLCNGALVGVSAGAGMYITARAQNHPSALMLAFIVFFAMTGSCIISGLSGALIPLILRRVGADPATASSIFLTTATDVASMGLFLSLATILVR